MLDIFNDNAFSLMQLTDAINKIPFAPTRLQQLGLFETQGVTRTQVAIEERNGLLKLLQTQPRGGPSNLGSSEKRKLRSFVVPHIPYEDVILPEDIQDVRRFGSESVLEGTSEVVADRLARMSTEHDYTLEHLRVGAIQGKILDADATVIYDLFTEFGLTETSINIDLGTAGTKVRQIALQVLQAIETALGGIGFSGVRVFCGAQFWEDFIEHAAVKAAFDRWQNGEFNRQDPRNAFPFGGIEWERYRQDGLGWIATNKARAVPLGVPGLFKTYFAPGNMVDTVNTIGLPKYARQEPRKHGKGIDLYTESNPLTMCTRPEVLIELVTPADS